MGDRVYVQNPSGRGAGLQERVMALDADTGEVIWEYKFNLFQSDVPTHRVGWASPAADPETGNIYAMSGGAKVIALDSEGELLWERSFGEEWAAFTTHGGRTLISDYRRRPRYRRRGYIQLGFEMESGASHRGVSTSGPATSSMRPTRVAARMTRRMPRRSLRRSEASGS